MTGHSLNVLATGLSVSGILLIIFHSKHTSRTAEKSTGSKLATGIRDCWLRIKFGILLLRWTVQCSGDESSKAPLAISTAQLLTIVAFAAVPVRPCSLKSCGDCCLLGAAIAGRVAAVGEQKSFFQIKRNF